MYLIWDDHIYSSYYAFAARAYHGCRVLKGCSPTLRHRDHVHLSLSRAGGAGTTSWYTGAATVPDPPVTTPPPTTPAPPKPPAAPEPPADGTLDLTRTPYVTVRVPADGTTTRTAFRLRAGRPYRVTVAGLYGYGGPTQVADASCRWSGVQRTWVPYPTGAVARSHGSLNLRVEGRPLAGDACHRASHVYSRVVRPTRTAPLRLAVATRATGASGWLRVLVSAPGTDVAPGLPAPAELAPAPARAAAGRGPGLLSETVDVPAAGTGTRTRATLRRGIRYRLTVAGSASLGHGVTSDGRCVSRGGTWYRTASLDRRFPEADHAKLYVDGVAFRGSAPSGPTCGSRVHVAELVASRTGRLGLAVWDPLTRADDRGGLSVAVQRLTPVRVPAPGRTERPRRTQRWRQRDDVVVVPSAAPAGRTSTLRLRAGRSVHVQVTGVQHSGDAAADAACVRVPGAGGPATTGWRWTRT